MRTAIFAFIGALALGSVAAPVRATPIAPVHEPEAKSGVVQVWGGCGWGFHPNRWGDCVPNRYGYYRPYWRGYYWHRPYWHGYYYGGGYPYWHHRYWSGY